jgi:hypothetical protein
MRAADGVSVVHVGNHCQSCQKKSHIYIPLLLVAPATVCSFVSHVVLPLTQKAYQCPSLVQVVSQLDKYFEAWKAFGIWE